MPKLAERLFESALNGDTNSVRELLGKGAQPDLHVTEHGTTALMACADSGKSDACIMLLDAGADSALINQFKQTALDLARLNKHHATVEVLQTRRQPRRVFDRMYTQTSWGRCS